MVADLGDGLPSSVEEVFLYRSPTAKLGDVASFFNDDGIHGRELWRTDGTESGTFLLRDLCPGACGAVPLADPRQIAVAGDRVVFLADDGTHGVELGVTDGTADGTKLLADLRPGLFSSRPSTLVSAGPAAYFTADAGAHGRQLWVTDGTPDGTSRPTGDASGTLGGIGCAADLGGVLLFAPGSPESPGLWRSDGTPAGTYRLAAVETPQQNSAWWAPFGVVGSRLLFAGAPLGSFESTRWVSDGTPGGTHELASIQDPLDFAVGDGIAYFSDGALPRRLWRTDGTLEGTVAIPLPEELLLLYFTPRAVTPDGRLLFVAPDDEHGAEPWITDGVSTSLVADVHPGTESSVALDPLSFFLSNGPFFAAASEALVFYANAGVNGYELRTTDGTESGTALLADLTPGPESTALDYQHSLFPQTLLGGSLLLRLRSPTSRTLHKTDGTPGGTVSISTLGEQHAALTLFRDEAAGFSSSSIPDCFAPWASGLFFAAQTRELGVEPWLSDGTPGNTQLVADLRPGPWWSFPFFCTPFRGSVLFNAGVSNGVESISGVWAFPAPGAALEPIHEGGALPFAGTAILDERLFSGAYDGLFSTDGTPGGTSPVLLSDVLSIGALGVSGGLLFVAAEQLASDGTPGGLFPVRPPELGGPVSPNVFTPFGERVLFPAWNEGIGSEL